MAKCLVTGHKGYIGTRLTERLKELGHEVIGIDLQDNTLTAGTDINSINGLVEDRDGKFHPHWYNFKPEYVFHLACIPRVAYSVEEPVLTMDNNVMCGSNTLNFARKVGAKRVIYSSSSSIRGNGNGPTSPYGLQKMVTEEECRIYSELYGMDTVSLRYFNVYSPCQKAHGTYATAVSNFMEFIRKGLNPFITGDGTQRRDMANLEDIVSANIWAMERSENFGGKHYDVGTGANVSLNEIKNIVHDYFPNVKFDYVEERKGDVFLTRGNMEPLREMGWIPKVNILEGINQCFKKLKEELDG